jgi:hypothetical protein
MSRMPGRPVVPLVSAALTVVVLALAGIGVTFLVRSAHERRDAENLVTLGRRLELPPGATAVAGIGYSCPTGEYVRCGLSDLDVDTAAARMRAGLELEAERRPQLSCETWPNRRGLRPRECTIRLTRGRRVLFVFVSEWPPGTAGKSSLIKVTDPSFDDL